MLLRGCRQSLARVRMDKEKMLCRDISWYSTLLLIIDFHFNLWFDAEYVYELTQ